MVTSFIIESFYCIKTIDVMQMISYWSHRKLRSRYFETNQSVAFILHVTLIARHFFWYLFSFLMQQLHMRDFFSPLSDGKAKREIRFLLNHFFNWRSLFLTVVYFIGLVFMQFEQLHSCHRLHQIASNWNPVNSKFSVILWNDAICQLWNQLDVISETRATSVIQNQWFYIFF